MRKEKHQISGSDRRCFEISLIERLIHIYSSQPRNTVVQKCRNEQASDNVAFPAIFKSISDFSHLSYP